MQSTATPPSTNLPMPSISVDALLAARDAAIAALRTSRDLLDQADERLSAFGVSAPEPLIRVCVDTDLAKLRDARHWDAIVYEVDRTIWERLFVLTNIDTLMDHKTRGELFARLRGSRAGNSRPADALPPLTRENIEATFNALRGQTEGFFEKCVEAVYGSLSWDHKTNEPAKIGEKLIVTGAFYNWSRQHQGKDVYLSNHESLHDLERVLCILDGKPAPTHTSPGIRTLGRIPWGTWVDVPNPSGSGAPLMKIKCFRIGTTHVRITKRAHVDEMNRIMARRCPGALPEPAESKSERKRAEPERPRTTALAKTDKQRRQAFYTPDEVAARVVERAGIERWGSRTVLEPSAGEGALVRAALRAGAEKVTAIDNDPHAIQMLGLLRDRLQFRAELTVQGDDFFDVTPKPTFSAVIMNPPFANAQEVEHVLQAWKWVAPGGRLVAVMSNAVQYRKDGRYGVFAKFLADNGGEIEKLPDNSFEESGTGVATVLVTIKKPER